MCGICGYKGFEDVEVIKEMSKTLQHRGPDYEGFFNDVDNQFSLAHQRLSILDLSENGNQPMANEDGKIIVAFNGEIYNYLELRKDLESKGHVFKSKTDTEVIVHQYEESGEDFLKKIKGMFAIALWDLTSKKLILARDRFGKKPLYYFYEDGKIIFASEIKAILKSFEYFKIDKKISQIGLTNYLTYNYCIGEQTIFSKIKKVLPRNCLIFTEGNLRVKEYYKFSRIKENATITDTKAIVKFYNLLDKSSRVKIDNSEVPVGIFLSGGIDSSTIVYFAKKYLKYPIHTFSIGFKDAPSETDYAKKVSEKFETLHHEIILSGKDVKEHIEEVTFQYDEPLGDDAILANYFLARETKKYVTVVLAGEGGDELLGGYEYYLKNLKAIKFFGIIPFSRKFLRIISNLARSEKIKRNANTYSYTDAERIQQESTKSFSSNHLKLLTNLSKQNSEIYPEHKFSSTLNKLLLTDLSNILPEKFLMKADKATMAFALEERLPFLDEEVMEYLFSLKDSFKKEKYILKKAMAGKLDDEILNRKKRGFGCPAQKWMKEDLFPQVNLLVLTSPLIEKIFNRKYLENQIRLLKNGKPNKLWGIFALAVWYKVFFKNQLNVPIEEWTGE